MFSYFKSEFGVIEMVFKHHFFKYPSPANLTYLWNFGFISTIFLFLQIFTGIFLAMHYCSEASLAFASIEHIMRDINYGWLLKYAHSNGASFFFFAVYLHIWRNLYFKKYSFSNFNVWASGLLIFFLMIITSFIGYVLPWGQMSFWAATVITNLISAVPIVGSEVVLWFWGGYSVGHPTLSRFFSLHYVLPFLIVLLIILHFTFLHTKGSSNPSFISEELNQRYLNLYPYFILKDLFGVTLFFIMFSYFVFFMPDFLNHSDNYIEANPLITPEHIVPEWYFLPFYAILRSIYDKLLGILIMMLSIFSLFLLPIFDRFLLFLVYTKIKYTSHLTRILLPYLVNLFAIVFILLGWLGAQPMQFPFTQLSSIFVLYYFTLLLLFSLLIPLFFNGFLTLFYKNGY